MSHKDIKRCGLGQYKVELDMARRSHDKSMERKNHEDCRRGHQHKQKDVSACSHPTARRSRCYVQ
eukprot:9425283-Karenia_brevis.AAC.1